MFNQSFVTKMFLFVSMATCAALSASSSKADEAVATEGETVNVFGEGTLDVPAAFVRTKPKISLIQDEFRAKAGEGDDAKTARITMMAASGGVEANIRRWKGQFTGGNEEDQKTTSLKLGDWTVHLVDVSGTYAESMRGGPFAPGKTVKRENYAMAGAIIAHPEGRTFFVKMIGPAEVVKANHKAFVTMIKSIEK